MTDYCDVHDVEKESRINPETGYSRFVCPVCEQERDGHVEGMVRR